MALNQLALWDWRRVSFAMLVSSASSASTEGATEWVSRPQVPSLFSGVWAWMSRVSLALLFHSTRAVLEEAPAPARAPFPCLYFSNSCENGGRRETAWLLSRCAGTRQGSLRALNVMGHVRSSAHITVMAATRPAIAWGRLSDVSQQRIAAPASPSLGLLGDTPSFYGRASCTRCHTPLQPIS